MNPVVLQRRVWVLLIFLILILVLIDGVQVYVGHRRAQAVADISLLTAIKAKDLGQAYVESALNAAAVNGYNNDGVTNTVEIFIPPAIGDYEGADGFAQVIIKHRVVTKIFHLKYEDTVSSIGYFQPCLHNSPDCTVHIMTDVGNEIAPPEGVSKDEFANVDSLLKETTKAGLAFNKPESADLNETVTVELLISPSISSDELGKQISENGVVTTATVDVTPRMEAYLYSNDEYALTVKPLQESPEQLVGETSTTRWSWSVKAMQSGTHTLTLKVFQLIKYDGKEYWQEVEAYKSDIQVTVSFNQFIKTLDWKWVLPTVITALLIPAFWRWYDRRKKKDLEPVEEKAKEKKVAPKKKATSKKKI